MLRHDIHKIVIENPGGETADLTELTVYFHGSDIPWSTSEFIEGSPIKKWLRKHFYYL
jgi:hypothetical protein